ncbi:MAG: DNA topoisomerase III [Pseudomonadales bacterium]
MRLFIAEKPSLGRAIAAALPKPHQREDGFIRVANGDCVSWCIGHLLEQAEPHVYNPDYKKWQLEHLPIVPPQWQLQAKSNTKKQLGVLKKLVKQADQLVHAGDPDREGQLLVDQVIDYLGVSGSKRDNIQRCLINDLNYSAVQRALAKLSHNKDFIPLSTSALARSRADWLYGINMTRAYTLQGRKVGYDGVLSVGRVQTPVLGLVVRRDREIEAFVSKPFYEVLAHLQSARKEQFTAKWQPSEACQPHMDQDGRVLNKALAENVVNRITDKPAIVTSVEKKKRSQAPPLPYNLSALQIDAARAFGMSAKQVLDTCQTLYERHQLVTYPRSDSRHLPVDQLQQAPNVVATIANNSASLKSAATQADTSLKSKAWNDSKVEAHHAIIPSEKKTDVGTLAKAERQVYELIARQYLCQFYPKHEFAETRVEIDIEGGLFIAQARQTLAPGWKALLPVSATKSQHNDRAQQRDLSAELDTQLPALKKGDPLHCIKGELLEKHTQPPKHFTDATLLAAMTGIARFVKDTELRKILKDTDGLGTEATRAGIIELLFTRGFLLRDRKQIHSSAAGRGLIAALPDTATTPDMTAHWESQLNAIGAREATYTEFMQPLTDSLHTLIEQSKATLPTELAGLRASKTGKRSTYKKRRKPTNKNTKAN